MRKRRPFVRRRWLREGERLTQRWQPGRWRWNGSAGLLPLLLFVLAPLHLRAQTVYAVVFGDQSRVVGASTLNSGLFRSTDMGHTWEHLGPENLKAFSMDAVESAGGRLLFIAAGNGVHRSLDSGRTWRVVTGWRVTEVLDVAVKQNDPRWVYAATAYGVWYSNDTGSTWRPARDTALGRYAYRLMIDGERLLVAREADVVVVPLPDLSIPPRQKHIPVPLPRGFMYDTEGTGTRDLLVFGRNSLSYLEADTIKADDSLFAWKGFPKDGLPAANWYGGTPGGECQLLCGDSGVWRIWMTDTHINGVPVLWHDISDGLPTRVVHSLVSLSPNSLLLAGTWGHGVWSQREGGSPPEGRWRQSGLEGCQVWRLVVKRWK